MKKILGLDIGTNSIGWAIIEQDIEKQTGRILGLGSRIIPTDPELMSNFEKGQAASKNAKRRQARGARRLRQRYKLRRARLVIALKELGWLPESFVFENQGELGIRGRIELRPELLEEMRRFFGRDRISDDWVIYFLRHKGLNEALTKKELALILYNMNQRRGFKSNRLSGDDGLNEAEPDESNTTAPRREKKVEIAHVISVEDTGEKSKGNSIFNITLNDGRNGTILRKTAPDWIGKEQEVEITTIRSKNGETRLEFRQLNNSDKDNWAKQKVAREEDIKRSVHRFPGSYYLHQLAQNPDYRIKNVTIDRTLYIEELKAILQKQQELNPQLYQKDALQRIATAFYPKNEAKKNEVAHADLEHLFLHDIIYYQRPLKSKKSSIADCRFEFKSYRDPVTHKLQAHKAAAVSSPAFQEFRLWQTVNNIRILKREERVDNKLKTDVDVSQSFYNENSTVELFELLDAKGSFTQKDILKHFKLDKNNEYLVNLFRGAEDKEMPASETKSAFRRMFKKADAIAEGEAIISNTEKYEQLWHMFYSLADDEHIANGLVRQFGIERTKADIISKMKAFKPQYTSLSTKALKRLLPLMRSGKYWAWDNIDSATQDRLLKLFTAEDDAEIPLQIREIFQRKQLHKEEDCQGLPVKLAEYAVYGAAREFNPTYFEKPEHVVPAEPLNLRNPIVEQVVNEALRVVRDIWKEYGRPWEIHLELSRELKKNAKEREKLSAQMEDNRITNERIAALIKELRIDGRADSLGDVEKLKLAEQQVSPEAKALFRELKFKKPAEPTPEEVKKYRLWAEQHFISPYSGKLIPLNELFSSRYEVDHIIPRSRFFDDSMENKVVVESRFNKDKGNMTAMEYIRTGGIRERGLLSTTDYEQLISKFYFKKKKEFLLSDDVPDKFTNRHMNDTRYIGRKLNELLAPVSENQRDPLISTTGSVTGELRSAWGLGEMMKHLVKWRFERLQEKTGKPFWRYDEQKDADGNPTGRKVLKLEGYEKRIDHRHHALDALVIACTTRVHIKYLNDLNKLRANDNTEDEAVKKRLPLLLEAGNNGYLQSRKFKKPWPGFRDEAQTRLEQVVVSFKKNIRIIGKKANRNWRYVQQSDGSWKKQLVVDREKTSFYVRKSLHKATIVGKLKVLDEKMVSIAEALNTPNRIKDEQLRKKIKALLHEHEQDKEALLKTLKKQPLLDPEGQEVKRVLVRFEKEVFGSRVDLASEFDEKRIDKIPDEGIKRALIAHLNNIRALNANRPADAQLSPWSAEGMEILNKHRRSPLTKVTTYEESSSKFEIRPGEYTEADKGTNLYFLIYVNEQDPTDRQYETIPLRRVVEAKMAGSSFVEEKPGYRWFLLSPGDLVYLPDVESETNIIHSKNIYKMVSATGRECYFIPQMISAMISDRVEFGKKNKIERSDDGRMIKDFCLPLQIDRLGAVNMTT